MVDPIIPPEVIYKRWIDLSISAIVMMLNIAEMILLARIKRQKKVYEIVLFSLSVADFLFGLANVFVCAIILSHTVQDNNITDGVKTMYFCSVLSSLFHLMFIAFDRVIAVMKPLKYTRIVRRDRIFKSLAIIWLIIISSSLVFYVTSRSDDTTKICDKFADKELRDLSQNPNNELFNSSATFDGNGNNTTQKADRMSTILDNTTTISGNLLKVTADNITTNSRTATTKSENTHKKNGKKLPRNLLLSFCFMDKLYTVISIVIAIADVSLIISYGFIVYKIKSQHKKCMASNQSDGVSMLCVFIAGSFVVLTIPFPLVWLTTGRMNFYLNVLLVLNSGMNSIVYFFRGWFEKKKAKKNESKSDSRHIYQSHIVSTPVVSPARVPPQVKRAYAV